MKAGSWVALPALAGLALSTGPARAAVPYSSSDDDFVALFPRYPTVESKTIEVAGGHKATVRTYEADEANAQWLISATAVSGLGLDAARALAATLAGVVKSSGGSLVRQDNVKVSRYDGLEFELKLPKHGMLFGRICVTRRRIYEALVVTAVPQHLMSRIERFLTSFTPG